MKYLLASLLIVPLFCLAQKTYVPDNAFEQRLIDLGYDDVLDDSVLTSNINSVSNFGLGSSYPKVSNLTGIEGFTSLEELSCGYNLISSLDLSNNKVLKTLNCNENPLKNLNISQNTSLEFINLYLCPISKLDLSNNIALEYLRVERTKITSLDVSNNKALTLLICGECRSLKTLIINGATNLEKLFAGTCDSLVSINIGNNSNMKEFGVSGSTQLKSIDISGLDSLEKLYINQTGITKIDLSNNQLLEYFVCSKSKIKSLDISKNNNLERLECSYCDSLSYINIINPNLLRLECDHCSLLKELSLRDAVSLEILNCSYSTLERLNVSNNGSLKQINCEHNMLTCLNLKNGNNQLINSIKTSENYSLLCVDVDDSAYSTNNPIWKNGVDNWTKFSEDCRSSCTNTGIQKNTFEQSIIVYPNPNLGSFSIEVSFKKPSDISIFITNTLGEVVYTDFESNISKQNISINLDLADGLYYVRVLTVEGIELFPIIVAK